YSCPIQGGRDTFFIQRAVICNKHGSALLSQSRTSGAFEIIAIDDLDFLFAECLHNHIHEVAAEAVPNDKQTNWLVICEGVHFEAEGSRIILGRSAALYHDLWQPKGGAFRKMQAQADRKENRAQWHENPDHGLQADAVSVAEWSLDISPRQVG